ncbi:ribulose-phosphate 3-epimerase [Serpentinicella alkaliphila]|uniref:Ribulose-phosphate 3-epimerase n=1 Tax=Serpentinicella alkaliphila TaxID=1734049 RepID=A0A4R2THI8_9FIRM|nr:ribulose-phosphate 3-epimerase [Serpentinicella alkaliphila]QUH26222.1 ribulose-phosphate 3-epimerase [Serpentinicella alkaliphila]TCQ01682.1 ribulose-phosphate 3-epimerase [Serpentinicella alkaliphila]
MVKIAPSILSADFSNLIADIKKVEVAGCELLHIDVMDGHFVPNITLGPPIIKSLKGKTNMIFDVHLMIENPDKYIKDFVEAGADIITVHSEASVHLHRTIQYIKSFNVKAAVALNPATPLKDIEYILDDLDMVLIMTVNPGFGGQDFIMSMVKKIADLKRMIDSKNLKIDIQVDGGIKPSNVHLVADAGANVIVAGSAIFNSDNIEETVKAIRTNASK